MTRRNESGYMGLGIRLRSAVMPVMAMKSSPQTVMGMFSSWAWAMLLSAISDTAIKSEMIYLLLVNLRIAKVGDNGGLVECHAVRADSKSRPDEGKQPQPQVLQRLDDLAEFEVLLAGSRGVGWEACLDEFLLFLG